MLCAQLCIVSIFKVDLGSTLWIESPFPCSSQSHLSWQAAYQTDTKKQRRRTARQQTSCSVLLHPLFIPFFHVKLALRLPVKVEAVALWQLCESTEHPRQHLSLPSPSLSHQPPSAAGNGTTAAPDPMRDCCGLEEQEVGVGRLGGPQ